MIFTSESIIESSDQMFQNLSNSLNPQELKNFLFQQQIADFHEYLLFQVTDEEILTLAKALASHTTFSPEDFYHWKAQGAEVIGRTIDGDYLWSYNDKETRVLPLSFQLADIECLPINTGEFLKRMELGNSISQYIR